MGGESVLITTIDWIIDVLIPSLFLKLDTMYIYDSVSLLSVCATMFLVWFVLRRFT